jgi:hypothetical protein
MTNDGHKLENTEDGNVGLTLTSDIISVEPSGDPVDVLSSMYDGNTQFNRNTQTVWPVVSNVSSFVEINPNLVNIQQTGAIMDHGITDGIFPDSERVYIFHEIIIIDVM